MLELSSLPKYYTVLVGYVDKAVEALEECNDVKAKSLLIQGLGEAEEIYLGMWADE